MSRKVQENAFTCLREMEYFSSKSAEHARHRRVETFDLSNPAADCAYDVSGRDETRTAPPRAVGQARTRVEINNSPWTSAIW